MKPDKLAYLILVLAILAEYCHKLFDGMIHSFYISADTDVETPIYWSAMIYHWFNELLTLSLITIICSYLWTSKAAKCVMSGVFFWFFIEFVEITLQATKIINIRTSASDIAWIQLSTCLTISFLVLFMNKKKI